LRYNSIMKFFRAVMAAVSLFPLSACVAYGQTTPTTPDPSGLYARALASYNSGHFSDAQPLLREYLNEKPNDVQARALIGFIELKLGGEDAQAVADLREAIQRDPGNLAAHNNLGNALLRTGDLQGAIAQFETVLSKKPGDIAALTNAASAYTKAGNYNRAADTYKRLLATSDVSATSYLNYGYVLAKLGNYSAAADMLHQASQLTPQDPAAWSATGIYAQKAKNYRLALVALPKALSLGPSDPYAVHVAYAETLVATGQLEAAIKEFRFASIIDQTEYEPSYNLGVNDDAETDYRHAISIRPDDVDASMGLASAQSGKGDTAGAIATLLSIDAPPARAALVHAGLAALYDQQGDVTNETAQWKLVLAAHPGDPAAERALADLQMKQKDYADAAKAYDHLAATIHNDDSLETARGLAHESIGEHALAAEALQLAVTINPSNAVAWNDLGVAREKLGNRKAAIAAYRKAVAADPSLTQALDNLNRIEKSAAATSGAR
jgi:superkiller protein 3